MARGTRGTRMETFAQYSHGHNTVKLDFGPSTYSSKPTRLVPIRGKFEQEENVAVHLVPTRPAAPTSSARRSLRQPRVTLSPLQLCLLQIVQDLQMHVPDYTLHYPPPPPSSKVTSATAPVVKPRQTQTKSQVHPAYLPGMTYHVYEEVSLPAKNKVTFAGASSSKIPGSTVRCR
ncbi:hypothetical protein RvY_17680 [Ramazzottius varieornatus]|uniref:Uncharacterized protein n=1 Tax=Ramazzottius varieornatus TaxID=947166 RepID=A0A1D1W2Z2_RAMVA|nr:hypothetical protein RvY_17680 [Ramazzottius varieornatus]